MVYVIHMFTLSFKNISVVFKAKYSQKYILQTRSHRESDALIKLDNQGMASFGIIDEISSTEDNRFE